ncbi:consortin [Biomphalaria pfeifferi]|uniref:Consortin n=1 Tax=Biomphalaria pfeifferi TaxID=112525 RepID=A0AAD8B2J3_BIOPF|nr:consortin [Biomphalaria pfeifferi]
MDMDTLSTNNNDGYLDRNAYKTEDSTLSQGDRLQLSTTSDHISIFQLALQQERNGNLDLALESYLKCLQGLKGHFFLLPHCLRKISEIHLNKGDYEQALHFAQAEKLCYETSPIINDEIQTRLEEIAGDISHTPTDLTDLNIEALRADEFKSIAQDYLHRKQLNIALEYAGKCTKIRQQVFGSNHEKTQSSLNFFKSLYADEKIQQYIASKGLCLDTSKMADLMTDMPKTPEIITSSPAGGEPVSILRQRSEDGLNNLLIRGKKQVHFHASVDESLRKKERDQFISHTVRLVVMAVLTVLSATLGVWMYCMMDRSLTCQQIYSELYQWSLTLQPLLQLFRAVTSNSSS